MLAEALTALASTASTALVTAMVTDGWEGIKTRAARLLGRGDPKQTQAATARLEQSRATLASAAGPALERAQAEQQFAWRTWLEDLLESDPDTEADLRALAADIHAQAAASAGHVQQRAVAFDRAQQAVQGHGVMNVTFGSQDGSGTADR